MWSVQKEFFKGKIDTAKFIDLASQWGIDAVELLDCFFKSDEEVDRIIQMLRDKNLPVSAYSIGNDFVVEDENELEAQITYVKEGINRAVRLGTTNLRVFSGSSKPGISFEKGMESILKGFRSCISYAEDKGITMVLENHGLFAGTASKVRSIIETIGSPNLKSNADTGNFLLVLENPVKAVERLKDVIGFVHFKDFRKLEEPNGKEAYTAIDGTLYQGTPIGQGEVDLKKIVDILDNEGYDGYLSIEYEGIGDPIQETEQSIGYLKNILNEIKSNR
jgi:sugar phosphate isomerase/epimerase